MAEFPTRREQIEAAYDNWNINRSVDNKTLRDLGYDTVDSLPETIERTQAMGERPVNRTTQLELVDENHVPEPDAKREARLRKPHKPQSRRERLIADQPPESQRVTPHGHDYIPTKINGGKLDRG